jgi:hypothetical protein
LQGIFIAQTIVMSKALLIFLGCLLAASLSFAQSVNFTSSNLPIIIINTNGQTIPDEPKITADMGMINNPNGARNNVTDPFNEYNGKIGIEVRGESSQMFPMKSYSIELRKASGSSQDLPMLGLPKESDWVLYAPYTDKTLMRNFLAYTMSRELGHWAANCRFVEVILNGDYVGVYVFIEKIKRNSGRVNIAKMAKTDISGDALTGGYIFALDKEPDGWFSGIKPPNSNNNNSRQFTYTTPKLADIVPEQKAYIKSYVDSFEAALNGPQYQDPVKGVRNFADITSFIDYFIVNEVSRNVDGYRLSSYFYKDRNSINRKIIAGPVWDYDLAFRNANYCSGSDVNGWAYQFNYVCPGDGAGLIPFWWNRFMTDTAFVSELRCRWKAKRQTSLSLNRINQLIDSVNTLVSEAQQRHFTRWPILGQYVWPNPNPIPTTYAGEISQLKSWISSRMDWIDINLPNAGACADWPTGKPGTMIVSAYPNPFNGSGQLIIQSKENQTVQMQSVDISGRSISVRKIDLRTGNNTVSLQADSWPAGVYIIRIMNDKGEKVMEKMVKR